MPDDAPTEDTLHRTMFTAAGTYSLQEWNGVNDTGMTPMCDNVLIQVDPAAATHRGLIMTDQKREEITLASLTGILVAAGPQAFAYDADRMVKWEGLRPVPGNRVWFKRYAGQEYYAVDGTLYRVMRDRDIGLVETPKAAA